jgi:multidrug efflux pump subunit AcrA (membrane-fusion protein)
MSQISNNRRRRSIRRIIAVVLVLVVLPAAFLVYRLTRDKTPEVRTAVLATGDITSVMTINTTIKPGAVQKSFVSRQMVKEVRVAAGDQVHQGDVLVTFDLTELTDNLKAAQDLRQQAEDAAAQAEKIIAGQSGSAQQSISKLQKQINQLSSGLSGATSALSGLTQLGDGAVSVTIDDGLAVEIAAGLAAIDPNAPDAAAKIQDLLNDVLAGVQISTSQAYQQQYNLLGQNLDKMGTSLSGLLGSLTSSDALTSLLGGSSLTSQLSSLGTSAQAAVAQAKQAEKLAQAAVDNAVPEIVAEMDGIVAQINAKAGEYAGTADNSLSGSSLAGLGSSLSSLSASQTPVVILYDNTHPIAFFQANRYDSAKLAIGMPVVYSQDGNYWHGQITYKGRIASGVSTSGSDASSNLMNSVSSVSGLTSDPVIDVQMSIEGDDLATSLTLGFNLDAEIQTASASGVLLLPAEALKKELGDYYVFVVGSDNRLVRRVVIPGIQSDLYAEVKDGLTAGERVVLNPVNELHDGLLVKEKTNG